MNDQNPNPENPQSDDEVVIAHTASGPVYFRKPVDQGLPPYPASAVHQLAAQQMAQQSAQPSGGYPAGYPMGAGQMTLDPSGAGNGFQPPRRDRRAEQRGRRRRAALVGGIAALALLVGFGGGAATFAANQAANSASSSASTATVDDPGTASGGSGASISPYSGSGGNTYGYTSPYGTSPYSGGTGSGSTGSTSTSAVPATADQTAGVVTIVSDLTYQGAQSAGTGIILTTDGLILTNNHVIEGSTSIQVTDESTGQAYTATVVGTDKTNDIAVLQLQDASDLTRASLASTAALEGDAVTAVGNAEGTGDLVAAAGTVTATDQTITTQSENGITGETLNGLIQVDADIVSGDSGGPLLDADGNVVGIDTAASSGSADITGFAIPIETAIDIVTQIEQGNDTETIEIGYPGFLGVEVAQSDTTGSSSLGGSSRGQSQTQTHSVAGALIAGVIDGTPGADAGIVAGDTITTVNGTAITTGSQLSTVLGAMEPGEQVSLTWTTAAGATQSATVTLIAGPAV